MLSERERKGGTRRERERASKQNVDLIEMLYKNKTNHPQVGEVERERERRGRYSKKTKTNITASSTCASLACSALILRLTLCPPSQRTQQAVMPESYTCHILGEDRDELGKRKFNSSESDPLANACSRVHHRQAPYLTNLA